MSDSHTCLPAQVRELLREGGAMRFYRGFWVKSASDSNRTGRLTRPVLKHSCHELTPCSQKRVGTSRSGKLIVETRSFPQVWLCCTQWRRFQHCVCGLSEGAPGRP